MLVAHTIEDLQNEWRNPYLQWYAAGMPVFNTHDISPNKQLKLKFNTIEDREAFAELTRCSLTEKTNMIWYPDKGREKNIMNKIIEDE